MASRNDRIAVEVAYATSTHQLLLKIEVAPDTRVTDVIDQSGILKHFPEIDINRCRTGIFSRPVGLDAPVQAGDRVEIYRELVADPKLVRRQRVAKARRRAGSG
ncbi:MAG: RnfH family protein [Stenotrophobium sp.]